MNTAREFDIHRTHETIFEQFLTVVCRDHDQRVLRQSRVSQQGSQAAEELAMVCDSVLGCGTVGDANQVYEFMDCAPLSL